LQEDLADLLTPQSTCLEEAECQAQLQIRVAEMRLNLRELRQQTSTFPTLIETLRQPLLATLDVTHFATSTLSDLEVMGVQARHMTGAVPITADNVALAQQFTNAMCKTSDMRAMQGREFSQPSWFLSYYRCDTAVDDGTVWSPFDIPLEADAEVSVLLNKLLTGIREATQTFQRPLRIMDASVTSALGSMTAFNQRADAFLSSYHGVVQAYTEVEEYNTHVVRGLELTAGAEAATPPRASACCTHPRQHHCERLITGWCGGLGREAPELSV
jgi:hypothetical protein